MLKKKLLIIVAIVFILAFSLFYWFNFRYKLAINKSQDSALPVSQISEEILRQIGPPPGFNESKVSESDPEILKLIGPPPGYKPPESNEISPEILKLIGPPSSTNK